MENQIPIHVIKRGRNAQEATFKQASPFLLQKLKENRPPSIPKPRNSNLEPRHQTLDCDKQTKGSRTRRISSSAAAKRFPKDFFKDENCLHPIKSIKPKHKQCDPCMLDTFSHKNFMAVEVNTENNQKQESDTPKFKQKIEKKQVKTDNDRLRNKVDQLTQQTLGNKYHTAASSNQNKNPLLQIFQPQKQQSQPFGPIPFISNFNVTLGQKVALTFLMQKQKIQKNKKKKIDEKQNNEGIRPDSARRSSNPKGEGFRIRRKLQ